MPDVPPVLHKAQRRFAAVLRDADDATQALPLLSGDAARNRAVLDIYRGNAVANVAKALGLAFPVVRMIVGDAFFDALARACWVAQPSHSSDLNVYGACFARFLAGFPHVRHLPYLPDVARLEWCVHTAEVAADHEVATLEALSALAPEEVGAVCVDLQSGMRILDSTWPLATIWQQHQAAFEGAIDVDLDVPECAMVYRRGWRVDVVAVAPAEAAFWRALTDGANLATALEQAFTVDARFDVAQALQGGFQRELVTALIG